MKTQRQAWFLAATTLVVVGCGPMISTPTPPTSTVSPSSTARPSPTAQAAALPYELFCGSLEREDCLTKAAQIAANAAAQYPTKEIVSISIFSPEGDVQVRFDDGTAYMLIID